MTFSVHDLKNQCVICADDTGQWGIFILSDHTFSKEIGRNTKKTTIIQVETHLHGTAVKGMRLTETRKWWTPIEKVVAIIDRRDVGQHLAYLKDAELALKDARKAFLMKVMLLSLAP